MKAVLPVKIFNLSYVVLFTGVFLCLTANSFAQDFDTTNTAQQFTLKDCIDYALKHQPTVKQSEINITVAKVTNSINEADLYPQLNGSATATHYFQLPPTATSSSGTGTVVAPGVQNTAIPSLQVSQAIFSPALIYAVRSAPLYVKAAEEVNDSTKIGVVANVSKSFYNLLLTLQQINVFKADTVELAQSVRDAYHQYIGGIVDETDYEEATITLNNTLGELRQANENVVPLYATLKQYMGYPPQRQFNISYDSTEMMNDIKLDTTEQLKYEKRIEYQQFATQLKLQHALTDYYRYSALPTLSAFFDYDYEFENNSKGSLFSTSYPYSFIGLSLSVPIFNGFYRINWRSGILDGA
jgi:outer membrane protein TolC